MSSGKEPDDLLAGDGGEKMGQKVSSPSLISVVKSKIVGLLGCRKGVSPGIKPPNQADEGVKSECPLEQLRIENQNLKELLKEEHNRFDDLHKKHGQLVKEYNKLVGLQHINRNFLLELQMLFSETVEYHSSDARIKSTLERSVSELAKVRTNNDVLKFIDALYVWWKKYRLQLTVRTLFWRPDSWSRFEHAFPNNQITSKLILFEKYDRSH